MKILQEITRLLLFILVVRTEGFDLLSAIDFVHSTLKSVKNVAFETVNSFPVLKRHVGDTITAAIDKECIFTCSNNEYPRKNIFYQPVGNGCGVPALNFNAGIIPLKQLNDCCDKHDICYATCNNLRKTCDDEFKRCLHDLCKSMSKIMGNEVITTCKAVAKTLLTAVDVAGCKYYLDAQKEACYCPQNAYQSAHYSRDEY